MYSWILPTHLVILHLFYFVILYFLQHGIMWKQDGDWLWICKWHLLIVFELIFLIICCTSLNIWLWVKLQSSTGFGKKIIAALWCFSQKRLKRIRSFAYRRDITTRVFLFFYFLLFCFSAVDTLDHMDALSCFWGFSVVCI